MDGFHSMLGNMKFVLIMEEKITIDKSLAESICKYCEDKAIWDKLGRYNDFYYKIKRLLN